MAWLIILETILVVIAVMMIIQFFNIMFRGFAPFISTKPEIIKKIVDEIKIESDAKVYELGCGKAGLLRAVEARYPQAELIGVEYSFWPYLIARMQISLSKSKIKIIKKNLFKVNLADADLIYCYLNLATMRKLEEKFKQECKSGTSIISYAFALPSLRPEKIVELENGEKIYFYRI